MCVCGWSWPLFESCVSSSAWFIVQSVRSGIEVLKVFWVLKASGSDAFEVFYSRFYWLYLNIWHWTVIMNIVQTDRIRKFNRPHYKPWFDSRNRWSSRLCLDQMCFHTDLWLVQTDGPQKREMMSKQSCYLCSEREEQTSPSLNESKCWGSEAFWVVFSCWCVKERLWASDVIPARWIFYTSYSTCKRVFSGIVNFLNNKSDDNFTYCLLKCTVWNVCVI